MVGVLRRFRRDERGLSLTEALLTLPIMAAGLGLGVTLLVL